VPAEASLSAGMPFSRREISGATLDGIDVTAAGNTPAGVVL
jgi:hypothetical protein